MEVLASEPRYTSHSSNRQVSAGIALWLLSEVLETGHAHFAHRPVPSLQ